MRDVEIIAQHKLEGVAAGLQSERGFRLAFSKMKNLFRRFQRFVEVGQFVHVYEKVVVAGVFEFDSGGSDSHSLQTEFDGECFPDFLAVSRRDDVDFCAGGGFSLGQFQRSRLLLASEGADCQRQRERKDCNFHVVFCRCQLSGSRSIFGAWRVGRFEVPQRRPCATAAKLIQILGIGKTFFPKTLETEKTASAKDRETVRLVLSME